ncbi:bifunctional UDP-N-acetylglucosamine diphosphorylase/glucosamine-1-phosphate N-acetyltransferase GlmU [Niallia sp. Sow4_A1]|jgi:bifunctional UDP-N-acetylglucosamine pyrophosphorylase / glucosamine-1-phosphate N-acetyltransferase|uniref:Bifunctional protein GlmU n=1 Tax=Niallia hominis TaxID=3133173 RepID=A0ABV1F3W2_9BACI|nr:MULTISPECIES: bifunctional UDP-N-acetylglucosamine diphosphorylase/glucosamine-1-phosphate N-acetyltransferase GlmU [Bacillaceae]MCF2648590.1 bifunctional UDP-N-acetylglucosamine diphosphorylase/glucosamine-1-phosphate N-acetyltransferase GlmU [Niallia circulans]MCM3363653.1 bifunctional UDP-N-acetylglucosamine diphosphorylase/glucosamine-1-phosphate N-acetyltransferase GlmU [Niallia sp. MER TA 168]CAI9389732.1 Bifunctional protein GlmU [Bacillus sp. T2.9-1]
MTTRYAVILAAGQGTRMKSKLYKVLHPVCGKPMVQHVVDQVEKLQVDSIVTVIGHGSEKVKAQLGNSVNYVYQQEQLGTAHAVIQAKDILGDKDGVTLVICGDTPLMTSETIEALFLQHEKMGAKATILTAEASKPDGYGRIVRNEMGVVEKIVEHKDATEAERKITEINTGTYVFDNALLFQALNNVSNENVQGEYYLPDVIEILKQQGETVSAFQTNDFDETIGVNDRVALSEAEAIMRKRINELHMRNGVTLIDPLNTYIEADVTIKEDTVIYPGSILKGTTVIGSECIIGPNTEINNCIVGNNTAIKQSVAHDSSIGSDVNIGPFAHIRPASTINDEVKIGNFVEIKKATFGKGSKASHLSYIGDASVGNDVNIGCGTITVNYDGKNKFMTTIEDGAFIGCNSNLIAPVTIGKGAYVAAGSTITDDVPSEALSIARSRQVNKENYKRK